ncbi:DUF2625 family protein [Micromonospora soli]|uniref:DUF2625 family protein n=1 Tax=Micromonospora sp. NBRC 110009 TaxID=3061627 RepID=UPI002672A2F7|nr:DUF2625 family protein [Micromonospora sp. NBRC 110009]WKU00060.1 DUF2625 family protein [Micromonospora sp. NBRC 110009]
MEQSAWSEVAAAVAGSPYPVEVLPAEPARASACLATLEITTRSWLGAVVANTGGLLVDHGWLRVLGSGHDTLPDVATESDPAGLVVIGYDVMGGQFVWAQSGPGARPTVHYFGPDDLGWLDLEQGYADWLHAVLAGSLTRFYETLRWPGWQAEVGALALDQGLSAWPPPFTKEGKDLSVVSRKAIPLAQLVSFYEDAARQLGP